MTGESEMDSIKQTYSRVQVGHTDHCGASSSRVSCSELL